MDRDFKAEFDEWFEKCSLEDVTYAIEQLDKYGWLDGVIREGEKTDGS